MLRNKVPAALFVAAALIAGTTLFRDDPARTTPTVSVPDPELMAANGHGYRSLSDVNAMWSERVHENPADYLSRIQYGRNFLALARETGDLTFYRRAEAQLRRAAAEAPNDVSAQTGLASSLSAQHQFAAALDILTAVQAQRPDDLGIQAAIADAHIDLGDYETAFPAIDDLAAALPDNSATLSRQARVAALTGRNEDAVELAIESLNLAANVGLRRSDSASAWFQVAFFQYQAGMVDEAEQSLRSGLSIDAGHLGSRELLGKVLVAQGRLDEAASLYEDILVDTPAADLNGLLAEVYQALGRPEDADEQIRVGLDLAEAQVGRFPSERRHLAGFFADQDPERFLDLMEEDIQTRGDIYGFDLLAWARYLNGDVEGAQAQMHKALRLGTEDAPMLFHAGMIELAAGDKDAGRDHLARALALNPGFDLGDVAMARAALDEL